MGGGRSRGRRRGLDARLTTNSERLAAELVREQGREDLHDVVEGETASSDMDLAIPSVTFGQETTFAPIGADATAFACQVAFPEGTLQLDLRMKG